MYEPLDIAQFPLLKCKFLGKFANILSQFFRGFNSQLDLSYLEISRENTHLAHQNKVFIKRNLAILECWYRVFP